MTKINLQNSDKNIAYSFGLMSIYPNECLTQTCFAISKDYFAFYDDNKPDSINGDILNYTIKLLIPFSEIISILFQKYKKSKEYNNFYKVSLIIRNNEKMKEIFIEKKDISSFEYILKYIKKNTKIHIYSSDISFKGVYK